MFSIRTFNPATDYPRHVEIINTIEEEPVTVTLLQNWDSLRPPENPYRRIVAVDATNRVIAVADCLQPQFRAVGDFNMHVLVDPAFKGHGLGSRLFEQMCQFAEECGSYRLFSQVRDDQPEALRFAEQRKFVVDRHIFDSILDVTAFDESPYTGVIEAIEATGISFTTLAAVGDSPENRQKLFALNHETAKDIPGENPFFVNFDALQKVLFDSPMAVLDGITVAVEGDTWIGFAALMRDTDDVLGHFMTGVSRAYRGRKIALALKLLAIRYARRSAKRLITNNDEANAPMLAINRKLGYKQLPGRYTLILTLKAKANP